MFLSNTRLSDSSLNTTTTGTPDGYHAGFAYVGENLRTTFSVDSGSDVFINGIRCTDTGIPKVTNNVGAVNSQGFRVTDTGRLCINTGAVTGESINNGWALDTTGRLFATVV